MTVYDFCNLYIEGQELVTIYSLGKECNVFEGSFNEATYSEYSEEEIASFGIECGIICINID
jgi:hypothetical protein